MIVQDFSEKDEATQRAFYENKTINNNQDSEINVEANPPNLWWMSIWFINTIIVILVIIAIWRFTAQENSGLSAPPIATPAPLVFLLLALGVRFFIGKLILVPHYTKTFLKPWIEERYGLSDINNEVYNNMVMSGKYNMGKRRKEIAYETGVFASDDGRLLALVSPAETKEPILINAKTGSEFLLKKERRMLEHLYWFRDATWKHSGGQVYFIFNEDTDNLYNFGTEFEPIHRVWATSEEIQAYHFTGAENISVVSMHQSNFLGGYIQSIAEENTKLTVILNEVGCDYSPLYVREAMMGSFFGLTEE